jgi:hypothetical protein
MQENFFKHKFFEHVNGGGNMARTTFPVRILLSWSTMQNVSRKLSWKLNALSFPSGESYIWEFPLILSKSNHVRC